LTYNLFASQYAIKPFKVAYKPTADADSNTASSAKAKKNSCKVANSTRYYSAGGSGLFLKYSYKYAYTLSKYNANSSGEAPSPYLTPILDSNSQYYYYPTTTMPLDSMYMFLMT
jgi:hypothetical protein